MIKSYATDSQLYKEYPKLMQYTVDFIILMRNEESGMVVYSSDDNFPVGYLSHCWNTNELVPFNGKITLES